MGRICSEFENKPNNKDATEAAKDQPKVKDQDGDIAEAESKPKVTSDKQEAEDEGSQTMDSPHAASATHPTDKYPQQAAEMPTEPMDKSQKQALETAQGQPKTAMTRWDKGGKRYYNQGSNHNACRLFRGRSRCSRSRRATAMRARIKTTMIEIFDGSRWIPRTLPT